MIFELKPETERLLQQELSNGHFTSVDEIIIRGIQSRPGNPLSNQPLSKSRAQAAVADMRASRQGNRLPDGITIKQLIDEGRD